MDRESEIICGQTVSLSFPAGYEDSQLGQLLQWTYTTSRNCELEMNFEFINLPSENVLNIFKYGIPIEGSNEKDMSKRQLYASTGGKKTLPEELPKYTLRTNKIMIQLNTNRIAGNNVIMEGSRFGASIKSSEIKKPPAAVNAETITFDYKPGATCISWDPVIKAEKYMITLTQLGVITPDVNKQIKMSPINRICFENLQGNTEYNVMIEAMNGIFKSEPSMTNFVQPLIEDEATTNATFDSRQPVNDQSDSETDNGLLPPTSISNINDDSVIISASPEEQKILIDQGQKFVNSFINWHQFAYTQWHEAMNKYVPYLEAKLQTGETLKNLSVVCPENNIKLSRCVKSETIIDHNGCSFTFCLEAEAGKYALNLLLEKKPD